LRQRMQAFRNLPPEQQRHLRERFREMSPQQRAQALERMRERSAPGGGFGNHRDQKSDN